MSQVKHIHDIRMLAAWDGTANPGPAIDPWEGRAMTWHIHQRNMANNVAWVIECAPPDQNDDTQPDNTAWQTVEYRSDPCDNASAMQQARIDFTPADNGTVTSIEIPMCPSCKYYRIRHLGNPPNVNDEVRIYVEISHLRNKS